MILTLERKVTPSVMILDGVRRCGLLEIKLVEESIDALLEIESLDDRFSESLMFFLRLVWNTEAILAEVGDQKSELLFNHIKNLVGEHASQWAKISETNTILITQFFLVQLKARRRIYYEISLQWALFLTLSGSNSTVFLYNILRLAEAICMAPDEDWIPLKESRDELFHQVLSLFVIESNVEKLSGPVKECLTCLSNIARAVPENILLESALFEDVNCIS